MVRFAGLVRKSWNLTLSILEVSSEVSSEASSMDALGIDARMDIMQGVRGTAMMIGVPREIKDHEYRVSMTPDGVRALCTAGHTVYVESSAGEASGFSDEEYRKAGARLASSKEEVWREAELVVK